MIALAAPPEPDVLDTVSASRLKCWLACRLKFFFRYIEKLPSPSSPALHVGKTVHSVLQAWSLARWHGQPLERSDLESLFHQNFDQDQIGQVIDWNDGEAEAKATAWAVLSAYLDQTPIPPEEKPEGVEVRLEADLGKYGLPVLVGVLDLVRPGGRIVDFKTSGQTPRENQSFHQHELQLSCYSVLYREATGQREHGLELHQLVKTKTPKIVLSAFPPMTGDQQIRLFRILESYVEGVQREDYVPSPGLQCGSCEYFSHCRRWT